MPPLRAQPPRYQHPHQTALVLQLMNLYDRVLLPQVHGSLGFTLGVMRFGGLDRCVETGTHHWGLTQSSVPARQHLWEAALWCGGQWVKSRPVFAATMQAKAAHNGGRLVCFCCFNSFIGIIHTLSNLPM